MDITDQSGRVFPSIREASRKNGVDHAAVSRVLSEGRVYRNKKGTVELRAIYPVKPHEEKPAEPKFNEEEISAFVASRNIEELPFAKYDFKIAEAKKGKRYAVALFSDAHIEETVEEGAVLGLNKYNVEIARKRVANYFNHLALCLNEDKVDALVFASLGDTISGYIHDELAQTNGLTPLEAVYEAQSLIYNGLRFIVQNTNVQEIKFIGICGNHSRTTKRIQFANGFRMSYEWLMYKNIEKEAKLTDLPVSFIIPESEIVLLDMPDNEKGKRRFLFMHGYQIKSSGTNTVCGIYPALNRLTMKYDRTFHQDRVYLGHFHTCVSIPNAVINGSIIGYTAFSMNNGFAHEQPAQMYQLYDTTMGEMLTRKIYCD